MASAGARLTCRGRPGACELRAALLGLRLLLLLPPPWAAAAPLRPGGSPRAPLPTPAGAAARGPGAGRSAAGSDGDASIGGGLAASRLWGLWEGLEKPGVWGLREVRDQSAPSPFPRRPQRPLVCGKPTPVGKIFGGNKAPEARWPWQASLLYRGQHICGATLIDHHWVASAAHCFQRSRDAQDYHVLLGYQQLHNPSSHSLQASVSRVIVHPDYQRASPTASDLALLQLHLPVTYSTHVKPACVPAPDLVLNVDISCWITGWGMLTENKFLTMPYDLQEGEVGIVDNEFCRGFFQPPTPSRDAYKVDEKMVCAVEFIVGRSICRGDSGGPLNCAVNSTWYLAGVSSFSADCRPPAGPSVFTRITSFSRWIRDIQNRTAVPRPETAPSPSPPPRVTFPRSPATTHTPWVCLCLVPSQALLLLTAHLPAL
ncbi:serine protease 40-like [Dasypus novemcinctus]|uniref:serine protease 40-like n=1 Tax=Dasypus novemcinctus TaxID=9361 RepID=UPI00265FBEBE|nr:serine protease 40-like [Dasypus novemcinctus]